MAIQKKNSQVIINKMKKSQFEAITPVDNELYVITDEDFDAVTDVRVDGDSVVENGIANVDLTGKQDVLTSDNAGTNVSITTDEDNKVIISATAQETNYRGRWLNYASVPTDSSLYPEDFHGNRKPTNNDFIVISDTSDYVTPEELEKGFSAVNLHPTTVYTIIFTDEDKVVHNCYYTDYNRKWVRVSDEYSLWYTAGVSGTWYIKTNKESDTKIIINGVTYDVDPSSTTTVGTPVLVRTNDSAAPVYGGLPPQAGQYQGTWRFAYNGVWDTDGKNGWKPQYQIENTLPIATSETLGIVKPDGTTITVDTDGKITAEATINTNENVENGVVYDWIGTLEEYEALETHDNDKVYFITDDDEDTRHNQLWGRSEKNAHPISAITGLEEALANSTASVNLKEGYGIDIQYPSRLPAGYTQLEYVESNGTQGIDTGIKYISGDAVYCSYIILDNEYTSGGDQGGIFGCHNVQDTKNYIEHTRFQSHSFYTTVCGPTGKTNIIRYEKNKRYNVLFDDCNFYINNVLVEAFDKNIYFPEGTETIESFGFCCTKTNDYQTPNEWRLSPIQIPLARFYEYWHADSDGNKKIHLVPAKDPDGVIGFYDLVSEEFKPSEIGTAFIAGPALDSYVINALVKTSDNNLVRVDYDYKMPEGYTRLEYIENNGKQYIDTEVTHSATDNVIAKVTLDPYKMVSESGSYLGAKVFGATYREDVNKIKCGICVDTDANGTGGFLVQVTKTPVQNASGSTVEDKYRVANLEFQNQSFDFESNNNNFYLSGVKVRTVRWAGVGNPDTFTTRNTIKLFAMHDQTSSGSAGIYTYGNEKGVRFYYYKHYDRFHNAKSILYPARRDSDGALGMYDFVNNVFHPNANANETATFIAGPMIIENQESPVVISTNVKLGEGLSFQTPEYDSMTDAKELVVDKNKALVNYSTAGERTFYDARGAYYYGSDTPSAPDWAAGFTDQTIIGDKASGGANYTTALGSTARATGEYNIGIGYGANAGGHGASIAIGRGATIKVESGNPSSQYCIAMGSSSLASRAYDIAIGCGSNATNAQDSIAIGHGATVKEQESVVIGHNAQTELFTSTSTSLAGSVVMGYSAQGTRQDVVIGSQAKDQNLPSASTTAVSRGYNIIIGSYAQAVGDYAVTLGKNAKTNGRTNVAIGCNTIAGSTSTTNWYGTFGDIAIGYSSESTGTNSICVGTTDLNSTTHSQASGNYSIAIGYKAQATAPTAIQLGQGTNGDTKSLHVYEYELFDGMAGKIPLARLYTLKGATVADDGDSGVVPAPSAGDQNKYLRGDGTWQTINTATSLTALTDTSISNPQDNHALVYSSAQGKWVNKKAGVEATYDATNFRITFA